MKDNLTCLKCRKKTHPNVQWQRLKERPRESSQALKLHLRIGKGAAGAKTGEWRCKQFFRESEAIEIEQGASVV